jgi:hypothetical protein
VSPASAAALPSGLLASGPESRPASATPVDDPPLVDEARDVAPELVVALAPVDPFDAERPLLPSGPAPLLVAVGSELVPPEVSPPGLAVSPDEQAKAVQPATAIARGATRRGSKDVRMPYPWVAGAAINHAK